MSSVRRGLARGSRPDYAYTYTREDSAEGYHALCVFGKEQPICIYVGYWVLKKGKKRTLP